MPGLTSLAIAESDERVAEALRYGFEREGVNVELASDAAAVAARGDALQVVVVGSRVNGVSGTEFVTSLGAAGGASAPVLYIGTGTERVDALAAGAAQFLGRPAFVRDVVTACRLLAGDRRTGGPPALAGELADHRGLYYLVRAVCALSFTGVLTLVRGLRRGEMRFFAGEVTSAQVGGMHGQAALHQLMLWTQARIELRAEDVVRRRQIPMSPDELLHEVRRFLLALRSIAPWLSPSAVYRRAGDGAHLPLEVGPVLRLFDGQRTVADAIEDSPFRVFETLRIAARLADTGLLERQVQADEGPPSDMLTLDDWLVGPPEPAEVKEVAGKEWEEILPSTDGAAESYASVVPSESTGGEIDLPGVEPRPPRAPTAETRPLPKLEKLAAEVGEEDLDEAGEGAKKTDESFCAAAGVSDGSAPAVDAGAAGESSSEGVKESISEQQRAVLTDAAGAIAEGAKVASKAAQRAASDSDVGDTSRDHGAAAGEIEVGAPSAGDEPSGARAANSIEVDADSAGARQRATRRRPATDPALGADAARVAAGAAQTARAAAAAFTAAEEAFFAAGDEIAREPSEPVDTFDDLETTAPGNDAPRGLVGRLFRKRK